MQIQDAKLLLEKLKAGTISPAEKQLIEDWVFFGDYEPLDLDEEEIRTELNIIDQNLPVSRPSVVKKWPAITAAAAILLLFTAIGYLFYDRHTGLSQQLVASELIDIAPGTNTASLTLANGRIIRLGRAANGGLANQGGVTIDKIKDGQVSYHGVSVAARSPLIFNTISTPKGGQYTVKLSDGTLVYLNAASSLRYPVAFSGQNRHVELTGEAYFEVAHDKRKPFIVTAKKQQIRVLGTHFNVNAYADEETVTTTLLQGSVKVSDGISDKKLLPGQKAIGKQKLISVSSADTVEAVAWKNGYFRFSNEPIESIMQKLGRWYNVDVKYEGSVSQEGFYGKISRHKNISEVLNLLKKTNGVNFKIDGREVTVMK